MVIQLHVGMLQTMANKHIITDTPNKLHIPHTDQKLNIIAATNGYKYTLATLYIHPFMISTH